MHINVNSLFSVLDVWDYQFPTGHVSGGMTYSKGVLKVPLSGLYTIYAQIYYTSKTYSGRHAIRINNKTIALSAARGLKVSGSAITLGAFHVNTDDEVTVIVVYDAEIFTGKWHTFFGAHLIWVAFDLISFKNTTAHKWTIGNVSHCHR